MCEGHSSFLVGVFELFVKKGVEFEWIEDKKPTDVRVIKVSSGRVYE